MTDNLFIIEDGHGVALELMRSLLRRGWAYAVPAGPGGVKVYFCIDGVRS